MGRITINTFDHGKRRVERERKALQSFFKTDAADPALPPIPTTGAYARFNCQNCGTIAWALQGNWYCPDCQKVEDERAELVRELQFLRARKELDELREEVEVERTARETATLH